MADRYWVGGAGTWDPASTSWSTTSGGSSGSAAPLTTDNAIFDANSGGGTVTVANGPGGSGVSPECSSLICTGFTGSIDSSGQPLNVNGDVTLSSGGDYTALSLVILDVCTFTSVGKHIRALDIGGSGSDNPNLTLADDLYVGSVGDIGTFYFSDGTINANNKNVSCSGFRSNSDFGGTRTLNMGSGTWTIFGNGTVGDCGWMSLASSDTAGMIINRNTSTINFTPPAGGITYFNSHNKTYYNLNMGGGANSILIFEDRTFNIFNTISTSAQPCTLRFSRTRTYTVTNFNVSGTAGNLVSLISTVSGTRINLSKASGTVSVDYLSIKDSNATGGATWYAGANSTNVSNNLGWTFTAPPSGNIPVVIGAGITIGAGILIN